MNRSYPRLRAALFAARAAGEFTEALAIAREAHDRYPSRHARTFYWQACILCLSGNDPEGIGMLEQGLVEGVWYNPRLLESDPDLSTLRSAFEFTEILAESTRRGAESQAVARPECLVVGPATAVWEPRWILALHQSGQSARECAESWTPLVNEGWTVVVPQSSQVYDSGTFCWDDTERARAEVRAHIEDCVGKRGMDANGLVIAGASQGAPLSLEIAHEMAVPWLCVIPGFRVGYDLAPLLGMPSRLKGAFLVGEEDSHTARTVRIAETLVSAGASVRTFVMPRVGHELPEDFIDYARAALSFLLDRDL